MALMRQTAVSPVLGTNYSEFEYYSLSPKRPAALEQEAKYRYQYYTKSFPRVALLLIVAFLQFRFLVAY